MDDLNQTKTTPGDPPGWPSIEEQERYWRQKESNPVNVGRSIAGLPPQEPKGYDLTGYKETAQKMLNILAEVWQQGREEGWQAANKSLKAAYDSLPLRAAQASEPIFNSAYHHASCKPINQDLVWHCTQCGHNEPVRQ